MTAPSASRFHTGTWSMIGSLLMITPAACTPAWRISPSSPRAVSMTCRTSASASYRARISPASPYRGCASSKIPDSGMSLPITAGGNALVIRSPSAYGKPSTRAESLTAALALMVP